MSTLSKIKINYEFLKKSCFLLCDDLKELIISLKFIFLSMGDVLRNNNESEMLLLNLQKRNKDLKLSFYKFALRFKRLFNTVCDFISNSPSYLMRSMKTKIRLFFGSIIFLVNKIPLGDFGKEKELKILALTIITIFTFGIIFSFLILNVTIYNEKLYAREFCLSDKCVAYFFSKFNSISIVLQSIAWLITLITTIGGIGIALMTYKSGVKNSNLTNHISHLNMFRDYVNAEITKRKFISPDKVNIYKWYSLIFPLSKRGDVTVSVLYQLRIDEIANVISSANKDVTEPGGKYSYKNHQVRLLEKVGNLGIKISTGPKNDFILIEEQVFELIDCINLTFTDMERNLASIKRAYI